MPALRPPEKSGGRFYFVHLFPFAVPGETSSDKSDLFLPTAAHAALSLHLPQAALELAAIPNTDVMHMYGSVVAG